MTPPSRPDRSPRVKRRLIVATLGLLLGVGMFLSVGHLLVRVDPLQRADAVYVLGGSRVDRALEGLRLYREGYAARIVLSPANREPGQDELERQGIHFPDEAEITRDIFVTRLGVPADRIVVLPNSVDNTAQEADVIAPLVEAGHWTRLIVITDRPSTRRAGYAFQRVLGNRVTVIVRCSREDPYDPSRWWTARWSFRATFYETPKLVAYWLGLRG